MENIEPFFELRELFLWYHCLYLIPWAGLGSSSVIPVSCTRSVFNVLVLLCFDDVMKNQWFFCYLLLSDFCSDLGLCFSGILKFFFPR